MKLSDSCVSKPNVSQKRSVDSSNKDKIPSKVVKLNSEVISYEVISAELNGTAVRQISSTSSPLSLSNYNSSETQQSSSSNEFLLNILRESWGLNIGGGNENAIRLDNSDDADVSQSKKPENTTLSITKRSSWRK